MGYYHFGMRQCIGKKKKKRFCMRTYQEGQGFPVNEISRVHGIGIEVAGKVDPFMVMPEMIGDIIMRQRLAVVSIEIIKSLFVGNT
jgi:hypothetical protein